MSMNYTPKDQLIREPSMPMPLFPALNNAQPLESVQLRTAYSHIRIGTYGAESCPIGNDRPPVVETPQKCKENTGPVMRLLKRRQNPTYLSTKSCDNIYAVNKSSNSLDRQLGQPVNYQGLQASQSNSLDWRIGRTVNSCSDQLESQGENCSVEHLSRSIPPISSNLQVTWNAKSKLFSFLKRLSPRLSRPSKNLPQSSPVICPWVQVEYSKKSVDKTRRDDSQESDVSFQQELEMNKLRKKIAENSMTTCAAQMFREIELPSVDEQQVSHPRICIEGPENLARSSGS